MLKANPFGLYDIHGNVWELCQDYFVDGEFSRFGANTVESPTGPESGTDHVARGGTFAVSSVLCRSACRSPDTRPSRFIGFRPALAVEAVQAALKGKP